MKKVVFIPLALFAIALCASLTYFLIEQCNSYRKEVLTYKTTLERYVNREVRIKNMTQSLRVNYGISEYEARYYSIIFEDFSQKYNIPWEIYGAVMRCESSFDPTLTSEKGAKGIMQMLESTAKDEAKILNIRYKEGKTLWCDIHATVLGISYLSRAIKAGGIEHGVRTYVGGSMYKVNSKSNPSTTGVYVTEYQSSVFREYERLKHIYTGVVALHGTDSLLMTDTLEVLLDTVSEEPKKKIKGK